MNKFLVTIKDQHEKDLHKWVDVIFKYEFAKDFYIIETPLKKSYLEQLYFIENVKEDMTKILKY
jgi:hypothetical protein